MSKRDFNGVDTETLYRMAADALRAGFEANVPSHRLYNLDLNAEITREIERRQQSTPTTKGGGA